jgi:hypothetical protein
LLSVCGRIAAGGTFFKCRKIRRKIETMALYEIRPNVNLRGAQIQPDFIRATPPKSVVFGGVD